MYKVFFESNEAYRSPSIEDALAFALSLHRSSNVSHTISVYDPEKESSVITLKRGDNV